LSGDAVRAELIERGDAIALGSQRVSWADVMRSFE